MRRSRESDIIGGGGGGYHDMPEGSDIFRDSPGMHGGFEADSNVDRRRGSRSLGERNTSFSQANHNAGDFSGVESLDGSGMLNRRKIAQSPRSASKPPTASLMYRNGSMFSPSGDRSNVNMTSIGSAAKIKGGGTPGKRQVHFNQDDLSMQSPAGAFGAVGGGGGIDVLRPHHDEGMRQDANFNEDNDRGMEAYTRLVRVVRTYLCLNYSTYEYSSVIVDQITGIAI